MFASWPGRIRRPGAGSRAPIAVERCPPTRTIDSSLFFSGGRSDWLVSGMFPCTLVSPNDHVELGAPEGAPQRPSAGIDANRGRQSPTHTPDQPMVEIVPGARTDSSNPSWPPVSPTIPSTNRSLPCGRITYRIGGFWDRANHLEHNPKLRVWAWTVLLVAKRLDFTVKPGHPKLARRTWLRIAGFAHSFDFTATGTLGGHTAGLVLWDRTAASVAKVTEVALANNDAGVLQYLEAGGVDLKLDTKMVKGRPALLYFAINNQLAIVK